MSELELSKDLTIITAEINSYKQVAGQSIFEIGKRLKHVRDEKLAERKGGWNTWCENDLGFSRVHANRFIKVFDELGTETSRFQLGITALYEISTMSEEQREQTHTIPSTGEQKKIDEMTAKELNEYKKSLKEVEQKLSEAETAAEQAKKSEAIAMSLLEQEQNKEPQVIEREVDKTDYKQMELLKNKVSEVEKQKRLIEERMKKALEDAESKTDSLRAYIETEVDPEKERKAKIMRFKNDLSTMLNIGGGNLQKAKLNLSDDIQNDRDVQKSISRTRETLKDWFLELDEMQEIPREVEYIESN